VPEPLDLGRQDRQIGLLGLALRLCRHVRDHPREHIEQLLFEGHEVAVNRDPTFGVRRRFRFRIFSDDRSL
jgi:hypothetical protein